MFKRFFRIFKLRNNTEILKVDMFEDFQTLKLLDNANILKVLQKNLWEFTPWNPFANHSGNFRNSPTLDPHKSDVWQLSRLTVSEMLTLTVE